MLGLLGCSSTPEVIEDTNPPEDTGNQTGWIDDNTYIASAIGYPKTNSKDEQRDAYQAAYNLAMAKIEDAFIREMNSNANNKKVHNRVLKDDMRFLEIRDLIKDNSVVISSKYNGISSEVFIRVHRRNLRKDLIAGK